MSSAALARLAKDVAALEVVAADHAPWTPYPGPQTRAYDCDAAVIGFGGAGGGGKTDLLVGKAFTKHHRAMLFRRQKTDELRNMVERSREIAPPGARLNETLLAWRGLPHGGVVGFGGLEREADWKHYRGHGYDFFGFDEATEFLESQVRSLMGWNRTTVPGQACQTILTFNPPTSVEGEWIIRFFAPWLDPQHPNPAEPGEHRYFYQVDDEEREADGPETLTVWNERLQIMETVTPRSRTFYPARVTDNPALVESGYVATLQGLPEPLRSQVLYGDFTVGLEDDEWQVIPTRWVRAAQTRWKSLPPPRGSLDQLGVDVARGGRDKTILAPRTDLYVHALTRLKKPANPEEEDGYFVAAHVLALLAAEDAGDALVVIDGIGVGASPYDILRKTGEVRIYSAIASEKAEALDQSKRQKFYNKRSQWWWHVRELLNPDNGYLVALPDDAELRADLCAPRWKPLANRVIQVESRDDIVKRLGRSPDAGTAVVLAFVHGVAVDRTRTRRFSVNEGAVQHLGGTGRREPMRQALPERLVAARDRQVRGNGSRSVEERLIARYGRDGEGM